MASRQLATILALGFASTLVACTGDEGPKGDPGDIGAQGDKGDPGDTGGAGDPGLACWDLDADAVCDTAEDVNEDAVCDALDCQGTGPEVAYVGAAACKICHSAIGDKFDKSGHPYKITKVEGVKPVFPFDSQTGGVQDPPLGMAWTDVSYLIGGFGWKVRYIDNNGYIVTGGAADLTQWNYPNADIGTAGGWVGYHAGEVEKPFDCGRCHTTGWVPCDVGDSSCVHQDDLPGMAGSFAEPGIQCEACHGPGSEHVANPYMVKPEIDRDSEACGKCHRRDDVETVNASNGFIKHHEQFEEMFQSKKHSMRCIDCHDPHASSKFADVAVNPNKGIRVDCASCHINYDKNQSDSTMQSSVPCIDCHMPRIVKSAVGDAAQYSGDIRSHLFIINPQAAADQFSGDLSEAMPYVSLDFACRNCHRTDDSGPYSAQTDGALETMATGYHSNPL